MLKTGSTGSSEIFREVCEHEMPNVMKAMQYNWPIHFVLYQSLNIIKHYKSQDVKRRHVLYLYGDYENGVYLHVYNRESPIRSTKQLHVSTANNDLTDLKKCLMQTQLIEWQKKNFAFVMINNKFSSAIEEAFSSNGLNFSNSHNTMFWYPVDKEIQLQPIPDDFYEDFLDGSYAEEMNKNWPHRSVDSVYWIKENLQLNFGLGIFRKSDKRLVSSALTTYTGGIFVLYTDPEFRGRRLAARLVERMIREIKLRGNIPFCTVIIGNNASEKVFNSVGFERVAYADYLFPEND